MSATARKRRRTTKGAVVVCQQLQQMPICLIQLVYKCLTSRSVAILSCLCKTWNRAQTRLPNDVTVWRNRFFTESRLTRHISPRTLPVDLNHGEDDEDGAKEEKDSKDADTEQETRMIGDATRFALDKLFSKPQTWKQAYVLYCTQRCAGCGKRTSAVHPIWEQLMACRDCKKHKPELQCITLTNALKEFLIIRDHLLSNVRFALCRNPFNQQPTMTLLLLQDVKALAIKLYGSLDKLTQKKRALEDKRLACLAKIEQNRVDRKNKRRKRLQIALAKQEMTMPDDCKLCQDFVEENGSLDLYATVAAIDVYVRTQCHSC